METVFEKRPPDGTRPDFDPAGNGRILAGVAAALVVAAAVALGPLAYERYGGPVFRVPVRFSAALADDVEVFVGLGHPAWVLGGNLSYCRELIAVTSGEPTGGEVMTLRYDRDGVPLPPPHVAGLGGGFVNVQHTQILTLFRRRGGRWRLTGRRDHPPVGRVRMWDDWQNFTVSVPAEFAARPM